MATPLNPTPPVNQQQQTQFGGQWPGNIRGIQQGQFGVFQYTPPEEHLVRGQMNILRNQYGQYIRQARDAAMELANARGQANSSYAAGAAERAAIDAALPIAAQDSETLTRIGLQNADATQRQQLLEMQAQIASGQSGQNIESSNRMNELEAQMAHELQLQRERLAFEGEQGGLGRGHDYGMGLMGMEGDLFGQMLGFDNQRQLGWDQYGMDLGRMGQEFGYNSALARLGADLGLRGDFYNQRWGSQRDMMQSRANLYMQSILQGMQVPEFMANPEAFMGFTQFITGSQWDDIFGGW